MVVKRRTGAARTGAATRAAMRAATADMLVDRAGVPAFGTKACAALSLAIASSLAAPSLVELPAEPFS